MALKSKARQGACTVECAGFTLVELMVALAITVILSLIAFPGYQEAVRKGRRVEARSALMQLLQQEERAYSQHNSYIKFSQTSTDEEEKKFKWFSGETSKSSAYEIKAEPCKNDTIGNCVQLTAMPGTKYVDSGYKDAACGELSLTSTGLKAAGSPDCWK